MEWLCLEAERPVRKTGPQLLLGRLPCARVPSWEKNVVKIKPIFLICLPRWIAVF